MPHLILEFSQSLTEPSQIKPLLSALHSAVCGTGLFVESHIKLRAYPCEYALVGGDESPFIHLQARIKPGRCIEDKRRLSEALLAVLGAQDWAAGVLTVEVVDMEAESYAKRLIPLSSSGV